MEDLAIQNPFLLFSPPFLSFFLSFLLPPFFLSSPLMVCECAPALVLLGAGPLGSRRPIVAFRIHSQYPIQPRNENGPGPIAALCDVTLPSYADASSSRWLKLRQLVKVKVSKHVMVSYLLTSTRQSQSK